MQHLTFVPEPYHEKSVNHISILQSRNVLDMYTGVHVYNDAKFAHSTMQLASLLGWL